jgi:uncharacterized protein YhaN
MKNKKISPYKAAQTRYNEAVCQIWALKNNIKSLESQVKAEQDYADDMSKRAGKWEAAAKALAAIVSLEDKKANCLYLDTQPTPALWGNKHNFSK